MNTITKAFLGLCTLLLSCACLAQTVYRISPFSDIYHATVTIPDGVSESEQREGYISKEGYLSVYDKSGKRIIKVASDRLFFDLDAEQHVGVNVLELPYGEQSVLIHEDFNFDGRKDLALMDGQNSCYGGPSFQVYLGQKSGFVHDSALTVLAQEYCGMFNADLKTQTISTMSKSGCCWHQFNTYRFINHELTLIESSEEGLIGRSTRFLKTETSTRTGPKKYKKNTVITMNSDDGAASAATKVLYFKLKNMPNQADKYVSIYQDEAGSLDYILSNANDVVEYSYSLDSEGNMQKSRTFEPAFSYSKSQSALSFNSPEASFTVYDTEGKLGVDVSSQGKHVYLRGEPSSKQGSLDVLSTNPKNAEGSVNLLP